MTSPPRTRADRLRLLDRIDVARHAAGLLRSKEEALGRERVRLGGYASRTADDWRDAAGRAADALTRARMLGGGAEVDRSAAVGSSPTEVVPDWQRSMGITYPGDVTVTFGEPPPLTSTAALRPAVDAHRRALDAAARHAAARTALERLDRELADTRRRRRALEDHLVPTLEGERHELDLALDELDREEALRVRTAAAERNRPRRGASPTSTGRRAGAGGRGGGAP